MGSKVQQEEETQTHTFMFFADSQQLKLGSFLVTAARFVMREHTSRRAYTQSYEESMISCLH